MVACCFFDFIETKYYERKIICTSRILILESMIFYFWIARLLEPAAPILDMCQILPRVLPVAIA
jgi:hypothetical protein